MIFPRRERDAPFAPGELIVSAALPGLPPSVNNVWKPRGRGLYKSPSAKAWQEGAAWAIREAAGRPQAAYEGDACYLLALMPSTGARMDGDNRVKILQDCLQMAGVVKDDSQVKDHRVISARASPPQTILWLWAGRRLPEGEVSRIVDELLDGKEAMS